MPCHACSAGAAPWAARSDSVGARRAAAAIMATALALTLAMVLSSTATAAKPKPHLVMALTDDASCIAMPLAHARTPT
jgi:hypothetical protein